MRVRAKATTGRQLGAWKELLRALAARRRAGFLFASLTVDWELFEEAGVPASFPELMETHAAWTAYSDAWTGNAQDLATLNAFVCDANRVRRTLAERTRAPIWDRPDRKNIDIGCLGIGAPLDRVRDHQ